MQWYIYCGTINMEAVQYDQLLQSLWHNAMRAKQKLPEACLVFPASSLVGATIGSQLKQALLEVSSSLLPLWWELLLGAS